jgi:hypothetical protein
VFRRRLEYPALKRAVRERQSLFRATREPAARRGGGGFLRSVRFGAGCGVIS